MQPGQRKHVAPSIVSLRAGSARSDTRKEARSHDLGDNVLKIIASVCTSVRRGSDTAARLGGDEFGLLLPETSGEAAFALAERLRMQVRACTPTIEGQGVDLSVSLGIAEADPDMTDIHALLKRADAAL